MSVATRQTERPPLATREPAHVPVVFFTNAWMMGGLEQNLLDLAAELVRRGHRVACICFDAPAIAPLRDTLRAHGVDVHVLGACYGPRGRIARLRHLTGIFRRHRGSVLHLSEGWPAGDGLVIVAARLAGVATIVRTEHQPPVPPTTRRQVLVTRLKDRLLARVVCVSEETLQEHVALLGRDRRKMTVIQSGIDLERYASGDGTGLAAELGLPPDVPVVGFVARLAEERKGARYFLEMAAQVAQTEPCVRFLVVGDGVLRPGLERQAAELGLASRVIFTGERPDVPALLARMQVFVMPSLQEGGPYTLLEAMAAGVPTVCTPVGLVPELINDGTNGLIAPLRDADALARGVLRLLRDPALSQRLATAARELVVARFSTSAMVDRYLAVYGQGVGTGGDRL